MCKKLTVFFAAVIMLAASYSIQAQPTAYVFNSAIYSYGTVDLGTGAFTSLNIFPPGFDMQAVTGDNYGINEQYAIMANMAFNTFYLWNINFNTLSGDSIGIVGPLAAGQTTVKAMAYNSLSDTWYVLSSDDFGTAAYLYTLNITDASLTQVAQLTGANLPVALAVNCDGTAYIIDVVSGMSNTGILKTLDLATGTTTAIGTDIGLSGISGSGHDMDFNPENGNLYWGGYWTSGFFSRGGTFRQIDITTGTSTEILPLGQYENYISFSVNGTCDIIPVELTSFSVNIISNAVVLNWNTATELNNSGFDIERKSVNNEWTKIGFVAGFGTTTESRSYSFTDNSVSAGKYTYRLKQIDFNGQFEYSQEVNVDITPSMDYILSQNYPNPFNPSTTIEFSIPSNEFVNLKVYNSLGQKVVDLVNEVLSAGQHQIIFDASGLASGVYIMKFTAGKFVESRKMNLIK